MGGAGRIGRGWAGRRTVVAEHRTCGTGGRDELLALVTGPGGRLSGIGRDVAQRERELRCSVSDRAWRSRWAGWSDRTRWTDRAIRTGRAGCPHGADRTCWSNRTDCAGRPNGSDRACRSDVACGSRRPNGADRANLTLRTRHAWNAGVSFGTVGPGGTCRTQSPDVSLCTGCALRPLRPRGRPVQPDRSRLPARRDLELRPGRQARPSPALRCLPLNIPPR